MTLTLLAAGALLAIIPPTAAVRLWPALRSPPVPIEVILGNRGQRRRWRRQLGAALRRLRRLVAATSDADVALLVAEWLPNGQRATCAPIRQRADGRTVHLVSLALSVPERRLPPDEVLAALAEQYLALTLAPKSGAGRAPAGPVTPAADQVGALLRDLGIARNGQGQ